MSTQLADATVTVNNEVWGIVPNTLSFNEGQGEQTVKAVSVGGGKTEQIYSHNVESNFSMVKFEVYATVLDIENVKAAKSNRNNNVVQIVGSTPEGRITRTFTQAALLNDVEKALGADTTIPVEFNANPAI